MIPTWRYSAGGSLCRESTGCLLGFNHDVGPVFVRKPWGELRRKFVAARVKIVAAGPHGVIRWLDFSEGSQRINPNVVLVRFSAMRLWECFQTEN
jgi:hypothetical protein